MFTREELQIIARLCQKWDVLAITDEIYEHIIYDGHTHVPMASLPGMEDRTVTINGLSKTFSVTGWRVGWAIAPGDLAGPIRKMHDFLTVGAPAPLQEAGVTALSMPESYYSEMAAGYARRRGMMCDILERHGFKFKKPQGAYYVMTDIAHFGFDSDIEFARYLVTEVGVAVVPGSSFFNDRRAGRTKVRFVYSKKDETLLEADKRLDEARGKSGSLRSEERKSRRNRAHRPTTVFLFRRLRTYLTSTGPLRRSRSPSP